MEKKKDLFDLDRLEILLYKRLRSHSAFNQTYKTCSIAPCFVCFIEYPIYPN